MVYILFLLLNRRTPAYTVVIILLHRNFTSIHRLLPCQTVVRLARVGATPAVLHDTPWPSRGSPYLHRGHIPCRFATVSPGGLTVEIRFMPEELRWCPGISRRCFAARYVPDVCNHRGNIPVNAGLTRCIPIQCGACRRRYGVVPVGPGVHTVATPGLKSGTVWTRLWGNEYLTPVFKHFCQVTLP